MKRLNRIGALATGLIVAISLVVPVAGAVDINTFVSEEGDKATGTGDAASQSNADRKKLYEKYSNEQTLDDQWISDVKSLAEEYPEFKVLLDTRIRKLIQEWKGRNWSYNMEIELIPFIDESADIKRVLAEKQRSTIESIKTECVRFKSWNSPVDDALTTIAGSKLITNNSVAKKVQDEIRDQFVHDHIYDGWSEDLEHSLKPLVDRGSESAKRLLDEQRTSFVEASLKEPLTAITDKQLARVSVYDKDLKKKHNEKREEFLRQNKDVPWSLELDNNATEIGENWKPAADLIEQKRETLLSEWQDKEWSPDLDRALAPLSGVYDKADDVLNSKRDSYISSAATKELSQVENDLEYLAEEADFVPAQKLLADKRAKESESNKPQPGKDEDDNPVGDKKVSEMTLDDAQKLTRSERLRIVNEALRNKTPIEEYKAVAQVYISDVEATPLNVEAMENARKLAELGVDGAQKAYSIQAASIAGTVLASVAVAVGIVASVLPQLNQLLATVGIKL